MIIVDFKDLDAFNYHINNVIEKCNLRLVITNLLKNRQPVMPEYLTVLVTYDDNNRSILLFNLELIIEQKIVSSVLIYYKIINNNSYSGVHSKTDHDFENKGYNQLLRSFFIMVAEYIYLDGKSINYIGSEVVDSISALLLIKKFKFSPLNIPYKRLTPNAILRLSGGLRMAQLRRSAIGKETFVENLNRLNLGKHFDEGTYFFSPTLLDDIGEKQLHERGLNQFTDWNYIYDFDANIGMNFISPNDDETRKNAYDVFHQLVKSRLTDCYDKESLEAIKNHYYAKYEENKQNYMLLQ